MALMFRSSAIRASAIRAASVRMNLGSVRYGSWLQNITSMIPVVGPLTNGIQAANEGRTEEAWKNAGYVVFDVVTFGAAGPGLRVAAAVGTAVVKTAVNEATHDHHKEKRRSG